MALAQRRRRRHLSITSLIDVIFLLLLFFMLASTFTKLSEVDISSTARASGASSSDQQKMQLLVMENGVQLQNRPLPDAQLSGAIKSEMASSNNLVLRVAPQVSAQRLSDIIVQLQPIDGLQVTMVAAP
ncbi:MAG: biopolymer transporter ExbD [Pseudomonadota bacterium]